VTVSFPCGGCRRRPGRPCRHERLGGADPRGGRQGRMVHVESPTLARRRTRRRLQSDAVADRCEFVVADFRVAVPAGADGYLLSRVIHDWDDIDVVQILDTCRAATPSGARLLMIEAILPEYAVDQCAAIRIALHTLVLFGARERNEAEYRRLLSRPGSSSGTRSPRDRWPVWSRRREHGRRARHWREWKRTASTCHPCGWTTSTRSDRGSPITHSC
jgi:O-methyltransferase domain